MSSHNPTRQLLMGELDGLLALGFVQILDRLLRDPNGTSRKC